MAKSGASCAEMVQPGTASSASLSVEEAEADDIGMVKAPEMLLNLIVGGLGTGMLSLPWAMAGASIVVGSLIIVLVVAVNLWTIMILVYAADRYGVYDLGALLGKLPGKLGPGMQMFVNMMVWVVLFGSLLSYIIGICDSAQPFIRGTFLEQRWAIAGLASLIVLPLCFLDQKYLSFSSGAAILVNLYLMGLVGMEFVDKIEKDELPEGICEFGLAKGSVTMVSTMMQSVIIQMCVLPMYKELENRSPAKFARILIVAFSTLAVLFIFLSVAGYAAFGPQVESNLLLSLPRNTAMNIVQAGMIIVLAAVYPVMMIAMIAPVKNLPLERFGSGQGAIRKKSLAVAAMTVFFVVASFLTALKVNELGLVNVVDGALCIGVFTALAPGLVGLMLLGRQSRTWRLAMALLLCGGAIATGLGFVFTKNEYELLQQACRVPSKGAGLLAAWQPWF
ncbi:Sodium-coupled neutral amino acid transporter 2 (Amino acid transporter A2) (Solute carrier family 38 member 2) (System A amino acid transporter 2) (System A transporter 1) (System N amino acid transporter 2) [Durusdinium trenchii]|uniref:Amino acid transporter transmembrane domain-containing protein n=1 Tax=Durusdinium trenchii TaxID=1381693 RepID=A0ABP0IZ63_9DINO